MTAAMFTLRFSRFALALLACAALFGGCAPESAGPDARLVPSFAAGGVERPVVLVNPNVLGNGTARTIQEGIGMVAAGGIVMVLPGTYTEALVIAKPLTLEGIGGESGAVIVAPPAGTTIAVRVATTDPVAIRGIAVHVSGPDGIRGDGPVNIAIERVSVIAVNPALVANLISARHDAADGTRARLTVRHSFIDGSVTAQVPPVPQVFGLRPQGDVDVLFEGNVIRRAGGACIFAVTRADLGGALNAEIVDNEIDQCHPAGRVASVLIGPVATNLPSPTRPVTATGVVNIIGNRIRNTSESCLPASAVVFEVGSGRIEHNQITSVVQPCAVPTGRNLQGAVWAGRRQHPLFPPVTISVRFNDIVGNAFAGLRVGQNQSVVIDASCNYWGSSDGPAGSGSGGGDAVVVESGAATPSFVPFAVAPIAGSGATSCE